MISMNYRVKQYQDQPVQADGVICTAGLSMFL